MNQKENQRQHFVPQVYLKRFTSDLTKNGKLTTYDLIRDTEFTTNTDGVAHRNKYYRLTDTRGSDIDPDCVDKILDKNLIHLNSIIESIIENKRIPQKKDVFCNIQMQMALLMARNPESRYTTKLMTEVALKEHMQTKIDEAPTELQKLVQEKGIYSALNIEFNEDYFVALTIQSAASYAASLEARTWIVVEAEGECDFITSDSPVTIKKKFDSNEPIGLDSLNSRIFFPISKKIGLIGEYGLKDNQYYKLKAKSVAMLNTQVIERPHSQIYFCPDDFIWFTPEGCIGNKKQLLSWRRSPEIAKKYSNFHSLKRTEKLENFRNTFIKKFDPKTFAKK